jgi:hypothetical protein
VRTDDRLFAPFPIEMDEDPKILVLSDAAFRALFEATFYSRRMLTDGFLDERVVIKRWGLDVADEMTSNDPEQPSWDRVDRGWQIHNFEKHHPLKADIDAIKQAKREAGRRGGEASGKQRRSKAEAEAKQTPSKTNPETETETTPKGVVPRNRGSRIPDPFIVTADMRLWASTGAPAIDVDRSTEKFVNHWRSTTRNATKLDWIAAWRNWLMNDADRNQSKPTPTQRAERTIRLATDIDMKELT